jgi:hypothetical protein
MQMTETARRQWPYAIGGHITVTDHELKVDFLGTHNSVALASIVGVDRKLTMVGMRTLLIRHPGGTMAIPNVWARYVPEILAAIGF